MEATNSMIELTRLNGQQLYVNCDLLKFAESLPDTVLTLISGEKIVVMESCEEVRERSIRYRATALERAWPGAAGELGTVLLELARTAKKENE
jgi:flagellar protein FlbD